MKARDASFDDLIAAARSGDAVAWTDLYHEVAPLLIGYLRAQRLPDPEDIAGEVMLEVVRDLERFTGDRSGFRSWVLAIAHHRLLDARRRDQRRPATPTAPGELAPLPAKDDPEAETLAEFGVADLEPALRELTDEQRTVLLLRVIGDLSIAEVARITGKRSGAVKQLQRRAVEAMRRALDGEQRTDMPSDQRAPRDVKDPRGASSAGGAH